MQKRKLNKIATTKRLRFHCDIVGKEDTQPTNIRCFTCSLSDRFFLPQIKQKPTKMFKNWLKVKVFWVLQKFKKSTTVLSTHQIWVGVFFQKFCHSQNIYIYWLYNLTQNYEYLVRIIIFAAKNISIFKFGRNFTLDFVVNILFSYHHSSYSQNMIYSV